MKQISQKELDERVAILKRFKSLLQQQRNKFQEYLSVLENQQSRIESEDGDSIAAHAELENRIVANIANLQKVIVPMQKMYNEIVVKPSDDNISDDENAGLAEIQDSLASLQQKVLEQNEKNRALLQAHMNQIRTQLSTMEKMNPYRGRNSIYAEKIAVGSMISIEG